MDQSIQKRAWISVLLALCFLVPCAAFAQVNTGSLSATVVDAQKALVDGADANTTRLPIRAAFFVLLFCR